jgi:hypothetical protein
MTIKETADIVFADLDGGGAAKKPSKAAIRSLFSDISDAVAAGPVPDLDARLDVLEGVHADSRNVQINELKSRATYSLGTLNGAVPGRDHKSITIPAGVTGQNTQLAIRIPILAQDEGTHIIYRPSFLALPGLTGETPISLTPIVTSRDGTTTPHIASLTADGPEIWRGAYEHTVAAADEYIDFVLTIGAGVARTSEGYIFVSGIDADVVLGAAGTINSQAIQEREAFAAIQRERRVARNERFVISDGGGDYVALSPALTAIGQGAGPDQPVRIVAFPGTYPELNVRPHDFAELCGRGPKHEIVLDGQSGVGVPGIADRQPMLINASAGVRGITVLGANNWHAMHVESGNIRRHHVQRFSDLSVINYGTEPGGSASAFGVGLHQGNRQKYQRIEAISRFATGGDAFGFHNNADWEYPAEIEVIDFDASAPDADGFAITLTSMGAGLMSSASFRNGIIDGGVKVDCGTWLSANRATHRGYRYEWNAVFENCSPFDWISSSPVDVLELRSVAGAASLVRVGDEARPYLFGPIPYSRLGGVGFAARAYSQFAISLSADDGGGMPAVGLGARLGNLAAAPKHLSITFDGNAAIIILLDQDYSAMTNAAVVANLNAKLSAAMGGNTGGRSFFVTSAPYANRGPIYQYSREARAKNSDVTAILKGDALAWDGRFVRRMTAGDSVDQFAGIALDDAMPGWPVRFQRTGRINEVHLSFFGVPAIGARDTFEVSGTAGLLVEGATRPIMRCHHLNGYGATFEFIGREN